MDLNAHIHPSQGATATPELVAVAVADLSGQALNWAVGLAEGKKGLVLFPAGRSGNWVVDLAEALDGDGVLHLRGEALNYDRDWLQTGPILEKLMATGAWLVFPFRVEDSGPFRTMATNYEFGGPTHDPGFVPILEGSTAPHLELIDDGALVAICRAWVAHNLGPTVQVPRCLVEA